MQSLYVYTVSQFLQEFAKVLNVQVYYSVIHRYIAALLLLSFLAVVYEKATITITIT